MSLTWGTVVKMEGAAISGRLKAWLVTLLIAGPIFIATHSLSIPDPLPGLIFLLPAAITFACFLGSIPLAVAVCGGSWLGSHRPASRHPLIWMAVGFASGAAMAPAVGWLVPNSTMAMILTGGVSGLIARRFVRWTDPVAHRTPQRLSARE
ncbi:hypothetical protein [uncultured Sphingomonas sp.]|uniref:hypothetical protein n=1 Tax=uncultured Sphingomonas sp. TaxID=158754 RepID=UPI0025F879D9|nr:hypothetical protein [uncultured Sphingomonas sp.]